MVLSVLVVPQAVIAMANAVAAAGTVKNTSKK